MASTSVSREVCVLVANRAYGVTSSRLPIIKHLVHHGWRVIVAAAEDPSVERVRNAGAEFVPVSFRRGGISPVRDAAAMGALRVLYRRIRPRLIHHFNTKPILLGGLAASGLWGTTIFNTVTGLGYGLNGGRGKAAVLRGAYRYVLPRSASTIFQNSDDQKYFVNAGLADNARTVVIASSGVETDRFTPREGSSKRRAPVILLAGRMLWQKGIRQFVEAASILRSKFPDVRICLGGEFDPGHPDAVPREWVESAVESGVVEFLGYIEDMPGLLRKVDAFVLPATFGEGFPRVLLEAASTGLPVVTTDLPGCREAVQDGITGYLVTPGNVAELASRVEELILDPDLRRRMGAAGRKFVVANYDQASVISRILDVYRAAGVDLDAATYVYAPAAISVD